jgi:hypothetical protein
VVKETFNASHHERERMTFATGKAPSGDQNADRHGDACEEELKKRF